jgi:hypothetical protein
MNDAPPRAPEIVIWTKGGQAIECPSLDAARSAATKFSARHPGVAVGVYQLIGFAHTPVREPEFTTASGGLSDTTD